MKARRTAVSLHSKIVLNEQKGIDKEMVSRCLFQSIQLFVDLKALS